MSINRFELRAPSNQTAVDIFHGKWITNLKPFCGVDGTGLVNLMNDPRIKMAASSLGAGGRFDGYSILELGPLEGAQTSQIEDLGARRVIAVEANVDSFLKCLILKELMSLKAQFLCGDGVEFLKNSHDHFDLTFCCGFLYHMADPVEIIKQICIHSDRCFVWSHYIIPAEEKSVGARTPGLISKNGFETTYYSSEYPSMDGHVFLGGNQISNSWLPRDEITRAFAYFGLKRAEILADEPAHPNGAAFSCAYSRF